MFAEHATVFVNELAVRIVSARKRANKRGIITVRHEADILAVRLIGVMEAELTRKLARMRFCHASERKQRMPQFVLRHRIEHVALVFRQVNRLFQQESAVFLLYAGIVTRNCIFAAQLFRAAKQAVKFQIPVAVYAGVRGRAALISLDESAHDPLLEIRCEIEHIIRHTEPVSYAARILGILKRTAALFAAYPRVLVIEELHRYADAVKSALRREIGGNGQVHSSAHCDECLAARVIGSKGHIIPFKKPVSPDKAAGADTPQHLKITILAASRVLRDGKIYLSVSEKRS